MTRTSSSDLSPAASLNAALCSVPPATNGMLWRFIATASTTTMAANAAMPMGTGLRSRNGILIYLHLAFSFTIAGVW